MVMRRASLILLLAHGAAHADDHTGDRDPPPDVSGVAGNLLRAAREAPGKPWLHLDLGQGDVEALAGQHVDDLWLTNAEPLSSSARETHVLELGHGARLSSDATSWTSTQSGFEGVARGWRAKQELSYDIGALRIAVNAGAGQVDSRLAGGSYRFAGISATRTFRLSRWMLAWISLGAGFQQWTGRPPPGESNGSSLKLTIGTTFR